jgi:hypothetical protein
MKRSLYYEAKKKGYKGPLKWAGTTTDDWREVVKIIKKERQYATCLKMKRNLETWIQSLPPRDAANIIKGERVLGQNCSCRNRGNLLRGYMVHSESACFNIFVMDNVHPIGGCSDVSRLKWWMMKSKWNESEQVFGWDGPGFWCSEEEHKMYYRRWEVVNMVVPGSRKNYRRFIMDDDLHLPHVTSIPSAFQRFREKQRSTYECVLTEALELGCAYTIMEYL